MPPEQDVLDKHRRAARVILADRSDRILLVSSWLEDRECLIWLAPGGALEEGESWEQAARRECWEETGHRPGGGLVHVWNRQHTWSWGGRSIHTVERYYFARVEHFEPEAKHLEDYEDELFGEHRWWRTGPLEACEDLMAPERLATLVGPLLAGKLPGQPRQVGV